METLELDRMPSPPAGRDRERENAEDLALFREFLAGRTMSENADSILRDSGARQARAAYTKIYLRYRERVYAYALRILSNAQDAEDLFQEVFYRVYAHAESFTEEKSLGGWIFTIAHNLCLNKVRDRKPQEALDDLILPALPATSIAADWQDVIAHAMARLPLEYREVIILREYEGLSYTEMTEILHTTIPSLKSRLYRAKGRLRDILAPYYKEHYG